MKAYNEKLKEYSGIWKITLLPTLVRFLDKSGPDLKHPPIQMLHITTQMMSNFHRSIPLSVCVNPVIISFAFI